MPFIHFVKMGLAQFKMGQSKDPGEPLTSLETKHVRLAEDFFRKKLAPYRLESEFVKDAYKIAPETLHAIIEEAREFLRVYSSIREEAAQLSKCEPTGELKEANEEIRNLHRELCEIREEIESLEHRKEYLEDRLKIFVGDALGC
jgi:chromosome segregation ATPase